MNPSGIRTGITNVTFWTEINGHVEQRDAALNRRFEEVLLSNEMTQFLRLHARDSDFTETVTKARNFAEASGNPRNQKTVKIVEDQSQKANQVNAFETGKSDWKPLLEDSERIMQNAIKPLQKALTRNRITFRDSEKCIQDLRQKIIVTLATTTSRTFRVAILPFLESKSTERRVRAAHI